MKWIPVEAVYKRSLFRLLILEVVGCVLGFGVQVFITLTTERPDLGSVLLGKPHGWDWQYAEKCWRARMTFQERENNRYRFKMNGFNSPGQYLDVLVDPGAPRGRQGTGTVHHIAFRDKNDREQILWQENLKREGYGVTEVRDRNYVKSIYFHEPEGILFEIATDAPGFAVDEPTEHLGEALKLPAQYEPMRPQIEASLPPLRAQAFLELNPALAVSYCGLGDSYAYEGRLDEAIEQFEIAIRLSPHDPFRWAFYSYRSMAHLFRGEFADAASWARRSVQIPNAQYWARAHLVAALGHLGDESQIGSALADLLRVKPEFSLSFAREHLFYLRRSDQLDTYIEAL